MVEHRSKYVDGPLRSHLKFNLAGSIVLALVFFGLALAAVPQAAGWWWLLAIFAAQMAWSNLRRLRRVRRVEVRVQQPHWFPPLYDASAQAEYARLGRRDR